MSATVVWLTSGQTAVLLLQWACMHAGRHILIADKYTMKPYVKKGYAGGPAQYATDLVAFKIRSSQHKALLTGIQTNTLLASQLHWFSAALSKDKALDCKQYLVKLGIDRFEDSCHDAPLYALIRPISRAMRDGTKQGQDEGRTRNGQGLNKDPAELDRT